MPIAVKIAAEGGLVATVEPILAPTAVKGIDIKAGNDGPCERAGGLRLVGEEAEQGGEGMGTGPFGMMLIGLEEEEAAAGLAPCGGNEESGDGAPGGGRLEGILLEGGDGSALFDEIVQLVDGKRDAHAQVAGLIAGGEEQAGPVGGGFGGSELLPWLALAAEKEDLRNDGGEIFVTRIIKAGGRGIGLVLGPCDTDWERMGVRGHPALEGVLGVAWNGLGGIRSEDVFLRRLGENAGAKAGAFGDQRLFRLGEHA